MSEKIQKSNTIKTVSVMKVTGTTVYGWGIITATKNDGVWTEYEDVQEDIITDTEMLKAVTKFNKGARIMKAMHSGDPIGIIEHSFPLTADIAKALGIDTDMTGWIVGATPKPEYLEKFISGEWTGFSIGGKGVRVPKE